MRNIWLFFLALVSCMGDPGSVDIYPDMEKKIQEIVADLEGGAIGLVKIGRMNEQADTTSLSGLDSAKWSRELQLFSSANFNKPIYRDMYEVEDKPDVNSNLTIRTYTYSGNKKVPVEWMEIRYLDDPGNWHQMRLKYRESNTGFLAHRDLEMNFENVQGSYRLNDYKVEGYQKILGQDTVRFSVLATIKY